jgi:hypothetical protein
MRYIIFILLLSTGFSATAQEVYNSSGKTEAQLKREAARKKAAQRGKFDPSRLVFGGGFGLSIGGVTSIAVSPIVGYRVTEHFTAGVGLSYQYLRIKDYSTVEIPQTSPVQYETKPLTAHLYAPSVWARHTIWKNVFAHTEYQHNFVSLSRYVNDYKQVIPVVVEEKLKVNQGALWVGAGIRQPISDKVSFIFIALYDVLPDTYGLFTGRLDFRFGINAGF